MLNLVIVLGRLTKDPEILRKDDKSVCELGFATDNISKDANGERGTTFFTIKCFQKVAENVAKCLHKGSKCVVKGAIQQRNFVRRDGSKGSTYEILADSVEFLDPKEEVEEPAPEEIMDDPTIGEFTPQEVEEVKKEQQAKFDPYTGKPLKPAKK